MQLSLLVSAVRRYWLLLIVGVIAAIGAGIGLWSLTGQTHTAAASVTLIPPTSTGAADDETPTRGNPLFYLGGLSEARDLVMARLRSERTAQTMEQLYPGNEFEVIPDPLSSGPVILINVTGPQAAPVVQQLADLTEAVPAALIEIQTQLDVPETTRVRTLTVTRDQHTTAESKTQVRNAIAGAGFVAVMTMLVVAVLERRHLTRMPRKAESSSQDNSLSVDAVTKA